MIGQADVEQDRARADTPWRPRARRSPCASGRTGSPARAPGRAGCAAKRTSSSTTRMRRGPAPASASIVLERHRARHRAGGGARSRRRRGEPPCGGAGWRRRRSRRPRLRRRPRQRQRERAALAGRARARLMSPPSRRARSREIDSPRPVPPYLRCVLPSAWRNASKIDRLLVLGGMPMPVSRTAKRHGSPLPGRHAKRHLPALGELERVREQVLQDLPEPLRDRSRSSPGVPPATLCVEARAPFCCAMRLEASWSGRRRAVASDDGLDVSSTLPASIFDRSRMSLISASRSLPAEEIVCANFTCSAREVAVRVVGEQLGEDQRRVERRAQLVGHVGQELALVLVGALELGGLVASSVDLRVATARPSASRASASAPRAARWSARARPAASRAAPATP